MKRSNQGANLKQKMNAMMTSSQPVLQAAAPDEEQGENPDILSVKNDLEELKTSLRAKLDVFSTQLRKLMPLIENTSKETKKSDMEIRLTEMLHTSHQQQSDELAKFDKRFSELKA